MIRRFRSLVGAAFLLFIASGSAQEPKKDSNEETAGRMAIGAVQATKLPALAEKQLVQALALWKKLYAKDTPPSVETPHFLLFGTLPGKKLTDIGAAMESYRAMALRGLDMQWEVPWPGKMAVFLFNDRREVLGFARSAVKVRLEDGDQGGFDVDGELPLVFSGPAPNKAVDFPPEKHAGEQMAGALLYKKAGVYIPPWMQHAFGRATVLRAGPFTEGLAERRQAAAYLKRKLHLRDVIGPGLTYGEDVVLKANLIDYWAYSGRTQSFVPFLKAYRPPDENTDPNFVGVLKGIGVELDRLDAAWQGWAKGLK